MRKKILFDFEKKKLGNCIPILKLMTTVQRVFFNAWMRFKTIMSLLKMARKCWKYNFKHQSKRAFFCSKWSDNVQKTSGNYPDFNGILRNNQKMYIFWRLCFWNFWIIIVACTTCTGLVAVHPRQRAPDCDRIIRQILYGNRKYTTTIHRTLLTKCLAFDHQTDNMCLSTSGRGPDLLLATSLKLRN